ncbi:MAG TPA: ATP-binding protein [Pseudonocardiaceae bacterium]|jgi:anti-sigma regulatory factor (Ser/Thr protein kinase)|nr:ATP-binding protein [Pseudonocardiaceae bacterium]
MASGDNEAVTDGFALAPIADLSCADIPATADRLLPLRRRLTEWAMATGLSGDQVDALILACDEAMSNVVSHAYPHSAGTFDLLATHRPDQGAVHVTIRDRGQWQPESPNPGPLHGRGLVLIRALAHRVTFEQATDGTTVHMTWLLPAPD